MSTQDLDTLLLQPVFAEIDRQFGRHIAQKAAGGSKLSGHAAAILSMVLQRGHICLHLGEAPTLEDSERSIFESWPSLDVWREDLLSSGLVGTDESQFLPMILDEAGRLYLHRYFEYEHRLAIAVSHRARQNHAETLPGPITASLDRLFGPDEATKPDLQKQAALTALRSRITILAGGPGTGKTTTLLKIMAIMLEADADLKIALAAPTGKAADRMKESILQNIELIHAPEAIRSRIPREASTIHRLLGARRDSVFFRHNHSNPLPHDLVVIDECSMVDLPLMCKLFDALKPEARVILTGDPDQLASVDVGSVLADIVQAARGEKQAGRKESTINQLANSMVTLTRNYRFGDNSGIDPLCQAIRTGDGEGVLQLLQRGTYSHIRFTPLKEITDLKQSLSATEVVNVYRKAMSEPLPFASLEAFNQGRILCAIKGGTAGMTSINRTIESILREEGLVGANRFLYDRRPVIIQRNDYSIRLFNGDVGILREDPGDGRLYAHFPAGSQNTRRTLAVRLPDHESAFAITIHRSQGSEFDHVLVILPPNPSPILTRELLYTAVSRAKQSVTIWANPETIRWACNRQVRRSSGLSDQILRHLSSS